MTTTTMRSTSSYTGQVNRYINHQATSSSSFLRDLKKYIKTSSCYPDRCSQQDYDNIMKDFKRSEKVQKVHSLSSLSSGKISLLYFRFTSCCWLGRPSCSPVYCTPCEQCQIISTLVELLFTHVSHVSQSYLSWQDFSLTENLTVSFIDLLQVIIIVVQVDI